MFYVPQCKATGPPVFNSIPHREFRIFFSFLPEALGEKMMMSGQYNPVNTSRLAYQQTTGGRKLGFVRLENMLLTLPSIIPKYGLSEFRVKYFFRNTPLNSDFEIAKSGKP